MSDFSRYDKTNSTLLRTVYDGALYEYMHKYDIVKND